MKIDLTEIIDLIKKDYSGVCEDECPKDCPYIIKLIKELERRNSPTDKTAAG